MVPGSSPTSRSIEIVFPSMSRLIVPVGKLVQVQHNALGRTIGRITTVAEQDSAITPIVTDAARVLFSLWTGSIYPAHPGLPCIDHFLLIRRIPPCWQSSQRVLLRLVFAVAGDFVVLVQSCVIANDFRFWSSMSRTSVRYIFTQGVKRFIYILVKWISLELAWPLRFSKWSYAQRCNCVSSLIWHQPKFHGCVLNAYGEPGSQDRIDQLAIYLNEALEIWQTTGFELSYIFELEHDSISTGRMHRALSSHRESIPLAQASILSRYDRCVWALDGDEAQPAISLDERPGWNSSRKMGRDKLVMKGRPFVDIT
ncbi:hypothetical protein AG1IA_07365 [Rhizoctonia solani AG-1 IA]|uniref:Uncharacterized protein n=1 Tax=Thanatephorus cucumeris (strain AG1-IA) TaxID=983506 RepID=L8WP88_THACA|nr:hypothetical protein AG1IA_07365 [Rhizoctonia solani AG-1 IA]